MASAFHVKEHVVEAQHVREYPRATAHSQDEVLYLAVKQYIPKSNPDPKPGDVTIVAAHANGFVKEVYEPLFEDVVTALGKHSIKVRGIWIADVAWQGHSGVINEHNLGNDPSWLDHARDLLHLVNHFRASMPRPLVGVGHSFGANVIVNLALLHPRLLTSLVLIDPVLSRFHKLGPRYGFMTMAASAHRRDLWPSRAAAEASFRRSRFYATWDPRALDAWCRYGLRDTPTAAYPSAPAGQATLTTPKAMEVFTYYRPRLQGRDPATGARVLDRRQLPDVSAKHEAELGEFPFYRPEGPNTTERLPELRPGVLWLFGEHSNVCPPDTRREKMELTGVGMGGSGGAAAGRVRQVVVDGFGHLVPLEATTLCAQHAAAFLAGDLRHWRQEEEEFQSWARRSDREKQTLDEDWKKWIGPPPNAVGKQKL